MEPLKPCPFCGEKAIVTTSLDGRSCVRCAAVCAMAHVRTGHFRLRGDAIAAWNRRAVPGTGEGG